MAYSRFNGNVKPFASSSTSTNRTVFGDVTQSDLINDNLNAVFFTGWEIIGINDNPTKQDFNALGYTNGYLISYLYQAGIPEYNETQNYLINSIVMASDGNLYKSLTGTSGTPNTGNNPLGDVVNWKSLNSDFVTLTGDQTIAGIKTFSSFPITPSLAPTTDYQVANKKYVDDNSTTDAASETVSGIIELATTAEAQAGTDDLRAITPLKLKNSVIGLGQTWQNVTGSRVAGITYTNSTGKPIVAMIDTTGTSLGGTQDSEFYVSGILVARGGLNGLNNATTIIVPNGATYSCTLLFGSITYWSELR